MVNPAESILRYLSARPSIGDLVLNCTTMELHGGDFIITEAPIEDGSVLTDHRIEQPRRLEMEAIISPYPDNLVDQLTGEGLAAKRNAASYYRSVWARIRAIASSNETFEVITDREVYSNMTFESYRDPEDNKGIIRLSAVLREIQIATVLRERFLADSFVDIGGNSADVGLQGLSPL